MKKARKQQPQLRIDMPFDEAMQRFIQTDQMEVEASIARSKQKKPPGSKKKKRKSPGSKKAPPGTLVEDQSVISLRDRRMRKRNYGR